MTYKDEVLADSPVLFLICDEASGALVNYGSGGGTIAPSGTGITYHASGPDATGLPFGIALPQTASLSIPDGTMTDLGDGPFTIEWFLKKSASGVNAALIDKSNGSGGYLVYLNSNMMYLQDGAGIGNIRQTTADTTTTWHHYAVTRGASASGKVYVDKTDVTTVIGARTFTDNNVPLVINNTANTFTGTYACIAIYKSALSAARIAAHYDARSIGASVQTSAVFDPMGMMGYFGR